MSNGGVLDGYAIGVTADRRAAEQISLFEGRGAACLHGPTVQTHPIRPEVEIAESIVAFVAAPPDITVATTGIGVRGWIEAAEAIGLGEQLRAALAQTRIFVRGPKANGAAIAEGLDVEWNAPSAATVEIVQHLATIIEPGQHVAVQVDGSPEQPIVGQIAQLGAVVTAVPVYRWTLPENVTAAESLIRALVDRRVDAITFTSRPAAENFVEIARSAGLFDDLQRALRSGVIVCCVGEITAAGLDAMGELPILIPERFRLGAMVMTLSNELSSLGFDTQIGGKSVAVQGRKLVVDDGIAVDLSVRERQLLGALVKRPGVVCSKNQLLDEVWGARESTPHVVEVTVGRLRRRLGVAGVGIETVMKRGYRASPD